MGRTWNRKISFPGELANKRKWTIWRESADSGKRGKITNFGFDNWIIYLEQRHPQSRGPSGDHEVEDGRKQQDPCPLVEGGLAKRGVV